MITFLGMSPVFLYPARRCYKFAVCSLLTPPPPSLYSQAGYASYPDVSLARAKEGRKETAACTLPMVPCGSLPVARLYLAKGGGWGRVVSLEINETFNYSMTRTTKSTRFDWNVFRIFSNNRLSKSFIVLLNQKKSYHCYFYWRRLSPLPIAKW